MASELTELQDARRIVLSSCAPLAPEPVTLETAHGRVLAETVLATAPVPSFENSAMDGFAVISTDLAGASRESPVTLLPIGESRAGHPSRQALRSGQAIAISTGAMLPEGADGVLRLEDANLQDGSLTALAAVTPGDHVRRVGEDIAVGGTVLECGRVIGAVELGVLASLGHGAVSCTRRPRVRILTTGDELLPPGVPLRPGAIYDSNAHTLGALSSEAGACVETVCHVGDDRAQLQRAVTNALDSDVTIICGGVSVGEHDHVRKALAAAGVKERFWGIALRPGKPTWFGLSDGRPVFALPGNPVSAIVTFILVARPALRALMGARVSPCRSSATLTHDYDKQPGRAHAVRCRLTLAGEGWRAEPTGPQGSHILTSMLDADALAILPSSSGPLRAGARVEIEMLPGRVA